MVVVNCKGHCCIKMYCIYLFPGSDIRISSCCTIEITETSASLWKKNAWFPNKWDKLTQQKYEENPLLLAKLISLLHWWKSGANAWSSKTWCELLGEEQSRGSCLTDGVIPTSPALEIHYSNRLKLNLLLSYTEKGLLLVKWMLKPLSGLCNVALGLQSVL